MPLIGLIIGLIAGMIFPLSLPAISTRFLSIVALSAIDSIFLGFSAKLNKDFDTLLFTNQFILNSILAIGLVYLGDITNTNLLIAVAIIFTARIFYNLSNLNTQLFFHKTIN